ncbi:zf-DHHC-domain-containing protein [Lentinus tigrinus ALCF2SS1-7]|uniref:Palmitoyltransferase n=1 Tax=Lentinus tigrinus ALCF2SS1-6 TaxID=1328759 RepID=A0A5C2SQB3_9APHY|nr:zf-DHHC-domain-containing protein [Lentinus tigrinus ALCF2SS1-6]RPD79768.1 zf-DHHC-domain-containing protein [Lentinus tigrinus ALCF2SS1-7]
MPRNIGTPLLSLGRLPAPPHLGPVDDDDDDIPGPDRIIRKRWYHYLPLLLAVLMILAPHPSLLLIFVNYYYHVHDALLYASAHMLVVYTLTFLAFSSLIVVLARDPGPVGDKSQGEDASEDGEESFLEALLAPPEGEEAHGPGKWCKKCSAPKPERAHHCGACGRCVLKMDHHCMWLGHRCIGHRTHASFVHFLCCVTLLAVYVAVLCASVVWWAFSHPHDIDETTPIHAMFLAFYGIVISMVIGSFCVYHLYLISTNQTTLESLSPFLLLRHITLPDNADSRRLSDPPLEHELSFEQRMLVRDAHRHLRLYDVGFKGNWAQVFGWTKPWGWVYRIAIGGSCTGDGWTFPRNPRAEQMLARLASDLVSADKDR